MQVDRPRVDGGERALGLRPRRAAARIRSTMATESGDARAQGYSAGGKVRTPPADSALAAPAAAPQPDQRLGTLPPAGRGTRCRTH